MIAYVEAVPIGGEFKGSDLDRYACGEACCTPGSATRILRNLRKKSALNYEVSNRARALYRRIPVEEPGQLNIAGVA